MAAEDVVRQFKVGDAQVVVLADEGSVAREAASRVTQVLRAAIAARGTAHLVLTGGSSAVPLHRELAATASQSDVAWDHVHIWWGDERFVPRDHPDSNAGLADRTLFNLSAFAGEDGGTGGQGVDVESGAEPGLIVYADNVHPMPAEEAIARGESPEWAARLYASEIERLVPAARDGTPVFDVVLAGVGPDGHTLSVFPGSRALADDAPVVMAAGAPEHVEPHLPRITLTTRVLPPAGSVIVMSPGSSKAQPLANVLGDERDTARWPAQAALLANAVWLVDEAAAKTLSG